MAIDFRSELARRVRCEVLTPTSSGFDVARGLWNAAVDRRPAAIVRCTTPDEVRVALAVAREAGVGVSIRGGGHGVAGRAIRDGALVLDLSTMRRVTVDAPARLARPGPSSTRLPPRTGWSRPAG
jgi:FAD/FMN-containing dehydrogenase